MWDPRLELFLHHGVDLQSHCTGPVPQQIIHIVEVFGDWESQCAKYMAQNMSALTIWSFGSNQYIARQSQYLSDRWIQNSWENVHYFFFHSTFLVV